MTMCEEKLAEIRFPLVLTSGGETVAVVYNKDLLLEAVTDHFSEPSLSLTDSEWFFNSYTCEFLFTDENGHEYTVHGETAPIYQ